ncbi:peptidase inhibitor family I36 protein [Streptomyces sp. ODS28]|uniref:peptidase inhibitor family I36 protein n=1 Tax=Streptomyces sp. ODS28 TaxID=3136688 RepID=UPI0031E6693C
MRKSVCGARVTRVAAPRAAAALFTAALAALLAATPASSAPGAPGASGHPGTQPRLGECARGSLCLWEREDFTGPRQVYEPSPAGMESCVPLPRGTGAASFANRTGHPVTVYESRECQETAEFHTHPSGTWTPASPYRVRAFKVWTH